MKYYLLSLCTLIPSQIFTATFVYNLRVAEVTGIQLSKQNKRRNLVNITGLNQYKHLKNHLRQRATGGLGSYIRTIDSSYIRIYGAVAHVKDTLNNSTFERTQTDDLLFYAGHGFAITNNAQGILSGIVGIPTHANNSLEGIQFGTGHYSIGAQADTAYLYTPDRNQILLTTVRLIHFFDRTVTVNTKKINGSFNVVLGELLDILVAHRTLWNKQSILFGYDATMLLNNSITPFIPSMPISRNLVRSSLFAIYTKQFNTNNIHHGLLLGSSYTKDKESHYTFTMWAGWGINF